MPNNRDYKRVASCELVNFAARDPAAFVTLCEGRYRTRIERAADAILDHGNKLVMLTGPSGTGKTTSARLLAAELGRRGHKSVVISLDDFFVGEGRYPLRPDGSADYECPESLDLPVLRECLRSLVETGRCVMPIFDFLTQQPAPQRRTVDCHEGVAIVEGLHALNPLLTQHLPAGTVCNLYASIWEEYASDDNASTIATKQLRLARRLTRDYKFRGHGPDFTFDLWDHVCESEQKYVVAYRNRADIILDTSFSYEPCLWGRELTALAAALGGVQSPKFAALCARFAPFAPVDSALVPADSMLREFIGPPAGEG